MDLSLEIINKLSQITNEISRNIPPIIKWVYRKNHHLTLKFIGNLKSADIEPVQNYLINKIAGISRFSITVSGLGIFPSLSRPRVIWIGIEESPDLLKVFQAIESATAAIGYSKEKRPFSPHITLGRVRRYYKPNEIKDLKKFFMNYKTGKIGEQEFKELILYRSILKSIGPTYTKIFSIVIKPIST